MSKLQLPAVAVHASENYEALRSFLRQPYSWTSCEFVLLSISMAIKHKSSYKGIEIENDQWFNIRIHK